VNRTVSPPLRTVRTLLAADHALLFRRDAHGAVSLVLSDPPQLPSQPFRPDDPSLWPDGQSLLLTDTDPIQRSPVGLVLAGVRGTLLAVGAPAAESTHTVNADDVALYLLWQSPSEAPAHVHTQREALTTVLHEQLLSMQLDDAKAQAFTQLGLLLRALPSGVVLTDDRAGTAMVNDAAAHLLGIPAGHTSAAAIAAAMRALQLRMGNASDVSTDAQSLFASGDGTRINWVWELVHPERRTLLVSTLPVVSTAHPGRLWSFHDVTALQAAEAEQLRLVQQLERERARLAELMAHAPAMIMLLRGPEHVIEFANDAVRTSSGGRDLVGRRLFADELVALRGTEFEAAHDRVFATGEAWMGAALRVPAIAPDGHETHAYLNLSLQPVLEPDGTVSGIFAHGVDVTAQVSAIEQLRQSQKMEAMGRLAGGVAHDFNNLLTVIGGNTELLLTELQPSSQAHADASEVRRAVSRAAELTQQLLRFSRRQVLQRHVVEIDGIVRGVEQLLRRVIGEDIRLETRLGVGNGTVMADPGQIEQVLVNLAVNARDAMPDGGTLRLHTSMQFSPPPASATWSWSLRGPHVRILVQDSGMGMDADTLAHACEPFFTTKPEGKGTGLGLATVADIMSQSGGAMWMESTPGEGTSIWLALPMSGTPAPALDASTATATAGGGNATVLIVEDEDGVRYITKRILEDAGYRVLLARTGVEGLRVWREQVREKHEPIDLVISDVVMPELGGRALVRELRALDGALPALFVSGYVEGGLTDEELAGRTAFLAKPFSTDDLLRTVAQLLGRD
jgi:signal transduction histidine kinase/ActR/RegA family two-component response regulator